MPVNMVVFGDERAVTLYSFHLYISPLCLHILGNRGETSSLHRVINGEKYSAAPDTTCVAELQLQFHPHNGPHTGISS